MRKLQSDVRKKAGLHLKDCPFCLIQQHFEASVCRFRTTQFKSSFLFSQKLITSSLSPSLSLSSTQCALYLYSPSANNQKGQTSSHFTHHSLTMSLEHSTVTLAASTLPSNLLLNKSPLANTTSDVHQLCPGYYLAFECGPKYESYREWLDKNHELYVVAIILYLAMIYLGKSYMFDRKPLSLATPLFIWNAGLAVFSIMGSFRLGQEFLELYANGGMYRLSCQNATDSIRAFWTFAFCLSKIAELGDTVFLVLRKRPVIFLHWYHHVTVLMFTWNACAQAAAFGRLFMLMNFTVHSFMYTYYALQSIKIRAPKFVSMSITTMQILQMVGGIVTILYAQRQLSSGRMCQVQEGIITSGLVMYGSYFVLFVKFFLSAYVFNRKSSPKVETKSCPSDTSKVVSSK